MLTFVCVTDKTGRQAKARLLSPVAEKTLLAVRLSSVAFLIRISIQKQYPGQQFGSLLWSIVFSILYSAKRRELGLFGIEKNAGQ